MPELPEVETMRRGLAPCLGRRIEQVEAIAGPRRPITIAPGRGALERRLVGRTIVGSQRAGKRVAVVLDNGDRLVFEPRMTGLVLLAQPPTLEHLRLRLRLSDTPSAPSGPRGRSQRARSHGNGVRRPAVGAVLEGRELMYWDRRGLGSVRLMTAAEFAAAFAAERLGPDALQVTSDVLRLRLARSRRAIKVALLDQRAVAGIGNLYAAEILHVAGVHPAIACCRLRLDDWRRLAVATRRVLRAAIRHEGSTLSDGTYRNALNRQGGYQNYHRVYDRAGEPCGQCGGTPIRRIVQAQRSTFFCPVCQPRRRPAAAVPAAQ